MVHQIQVHVYTVYLSLTIILALVRGIYWLDLVVQVLVYILQMLVSARVACL